MAYVFRRPGRQYLRERRVSPLLPASVTAAIYIKATGAGRMAVTGLVRPAARLTVATAMRLGLSGAVAAATRVSAFAHASTGFTAAGRIAAKLAAGVFSRAAVTGAVSITSQSSAAAAARAIPSGSILAAFRSNGLAAARAAMTGVAASSARLLSSSRAAGALKGIVAAPAMMTAGSSSMRAALSSAGIVLISARMGSAGFGRAAMLAAGSSLPPEIIFPSAALALALGRLFLAKPLAAFEITGAGVIVGDWFTGLSGMAAAIAQAQFVYGSGGAGCTVYLQTSLDMGKTAIDIAAIPLGTVSATKIAGVTGLAPIGTPVFPSQQALAPGTCLNGVLGDRLRVAAVVTGTFTNTLLTVTGWAF